MERDPRSGKSSPWAPGGTGRRLMLVAPQPFFAVSGTPLNILQMCRALTALGYEVHLATFPMGEDVALPGLHYHRVAHIPFLTRIPIGFSFGKAVYDALLAFTVLRLLWRHDFLAVHAVEEGAFFAAPLARLLGVPAIVDLDSDICQQLRSHRSAVARQLAPAAAALRRFALRQSTCAITVAASLTEMVAQVSPATRVFEIGDIPVDFATSRPDQGAIAAVKSEFHVEAVRLILYTGNFDERQGLDMLVGAMPLVRRKVANAALVLVGGEPHQIGRLRALAASLGVSHAVMFAGKRPPELMPVFMKVAVVLVSPRREPLVTPLKIYTYMASGRPIVATDLPTHTRVLGKDSAFLVPATAEGIASGIIRALGDPAAAFRVARACATVGREGPHLRSVQEPLIRGLRVCRSLSRSACCPMRWPVGGAEQ